MKVGGIEYAQSYGAGSAGDAMSERNALGSRRTNGSESSLPRVRSVRVWAECQQARIASPIRGDKCSTNDRPGTAGHRRAAQNKPGAAREKGSDADEDEEEGTAWGECWECLQQIRGMLEGGTIFVVER